MKPVKFAKKLRLPQREALQSLNQTNRQLTDYSKLTPLMQTDEEPASILQLMGKPRNAG